MSIQLEHHQLELRSRIDEVLHYIWDPIGVAGSPEARDEYDGYVTPIYNLLVDGQENDRIYKVLLELSVGHMGLEKSKFLKDKAKETEEVLLHWLKTIKAQDDYHTT